MDITVYLPDSLGEQAKAAGINLSRMLRDAVQGDLNRRQTMAKTLEDAQVYEIPALSDDHGVPFTGRITGKLITEAEEASVYLTTDGRVLFVAETFHTYYEVDDPADLRRMLRDDDAYKRACREIGVDPIIDL